MELESKIGSAMQVKGEWKTCNICGIPCQAFCGSCGNACYCSKEHQITDWKNHKKQCFPVKSIRDEENIRQMVAMRSIKQGELILTESPIFVAPNSRDCHGFTCLGCCKKIPSEMVVPCSECGWGLCSSPCKTGKQHYENECNIFKENGVQPAFTQNNLCQTYCEIGVLRLLLVKDNHPLVWKQLSKLNDFSEFRKDAPDTIFKVADIYGFIRNHCNQPFSDEEIDKAFGILRANAFDSSDYTGFIQSVKSELKQASLLFPTALIPGQNCVPNGHYVISGRQSGDYKISVIAAIDIPKGDPISLPYEDGFSGTFLRQEVKRRVFFQDCKCKRCRDPTELGSFISSPKCSLCKDGYYIQLNPLQRESVWNCNNNQCSAQMSHSDIVEILQKARGQLYECMNATAVQDSYKILKDLHPRVLHPNNFLILQTEIEICRRILTEIGLDETNKVKGNDSYADILIETSKHLLSIADILRPGFNRMRGRLLYCLQYGLILKLLSSNAVINKNMRHGCGRHAEMMKLYRKTKVEECKRVQDEAERMLKWESDDSCEERHMFKTLESDLRSALKTLTDG